MLKYMLAGVAAISLAVPSIAADRVRTVSGTYKGINWTASNSIVGVNSTATAVAGGDPRYFPDRPRLNGVASLIMEYDDGSAFICTGSLMPDRRSIVTAAHCVSGGFGTAGPARVTAYFYGGSNPDEVTFLSPEATAVEVSRVYVNPGYTGEVIDQNDIAVLRLGEEAPRFARTYRLSTEEDLTGRLFNVAGYGARSDGGGNVGDNLGVGRLRQGGNRFDFRFGDEAFGGFWDGFFGTAETDYSYLSDFDNGRIPNDASCQLASFFGAGGRQFCNRGRGQFEVSVAGGDSGGPQFVSGRLASVTSYGLTFGPDFGDIDGDLNSTFGEFNGFVPIYIHRDFIAGAIPEPATWAMMIAGFGMVGMSMRRRRTPAVSA